MVSTRPPICPSDRVRGCTSCTVAHAHSPDGQLLQAPPTVAARKSSTVAGSPIFQEKPEIQVLKGNLLIFKLCNKFT